MNVISASYGNDSMAMIQWAHETGLPDVTVAYCDTGWSAPGWFLREMKMAMLGYPMSVRAMSPTSLLQAINRELGETDVKREGGGQP